MNAGLCHQPDQWHWGSAGASPPWLGSERLLEYLGAGGGDPIALYAELLST